MKKLNPSALCIILAFAIAGYAEVTYCTESESEEESEVDFEPNMFANSDGSCGCECREKDKHDDQTGGIDIWHVESDLAKPRLRIALLKKQLDLLGHWELRLSNPTNIKLGNFAMLRAFKNFNWLAKHYGIGFRLADIEADMSPKEYDLLVIELKVAVQKYLPKIEDKYREQNKPELIEASGASSETESDEYEMKEAVQSTDALKEILEDHRSRIEIVNMHIASYLKRLKKTTLVTQSEMETFERTANRILSYASKFPIEDHELIYDEIFGTDGDEDGPEFKGINGDEISLNLAISEFITFYSELAKMATEHIDRIMPQQIESQKQTTNLDLKN